MSGAGETRLEMALGDIREGLERLEWHHTLIAEPFKHGNHSLCQRAETRLRTRARG